MKALRLLGADVTLVAPPTLLPESLDGWPVHVSTTSTTCSPTSTSCMLPAHAVRASARTAMLFPTLREYTARYGLTVERAARSNPTR